MRKVRLLLFLLTMTGMGFSFNAKAQHCAECQPCCDQHYVCNSLIASFTQDLHQNCGPGTQISIELIKGC